ncbi:hypothetical protein D9M68_544980 [compost metagenome]
MASVKSLPMKPMEATVSARMPASAPKPTALTNRMATMTGCRARHSATTARAGHDTQAGIMLRAPSRPMGSAISTPSTDASTAISRLSAMPFHNVAGFSKLGGNMRERNVDAWPMPLSKRAQLKSSCAPAYTV